VSPDENIVAGQVIVRFKPGTSSLAISGLAARFSGTLETPGLIPDTVVILVPAGSEVSAAASLAADPNVLFAEPNRIWHADAVPNDPRRPDLWGLNNTGQTVNGVAGTRDADIDAIEGWNLAKGLGATVRVADIDTGVTFAHPDLAGIIFINPGESGGGKETNHVDDDHNGLIDDVRGWDFFNNDNNPIDDNEHGTHVAGTIAARSNNANGVAGVASFPTPSGGWLGPKIVPIKVLNAAGSGTTVQIANGMYYAGKIHAKVANMSLGGSGTSPTFDQALRDNPTVLYVVAAGNDGVNNDASPHTPCVPASLPDPANKICVAATDSKDQLASFSNFSATHVDLSAPGVSVLSTVPLATTIFSDNFETDIASRWRTNDAGQTPAGSPRWARTTALHTSGSFSITDSPGGNYAANQNNWIRNVTGLNFTGGIGCKVTAPFHLNSEFQVDFLNIDSTRTPANLASWVNRDSWTGNGDAQIDNSLGFDNQPGVFLRFRMKSNGSIQSDGAYIDDVVVSCFKGTTGFAFFNGTSMATPHVSGVATLLATLYPTATVAQIKDRILRSVDKKAALTGKVLTGGRLNLYKAAAESSASVAAHVLTWSAKAGETNTVTVTRVVESGVAKFVINDPWSVSTTAIQSGSRIIPGAGCVRFTDNIVKCNAAGITRIVLNGNDLNDTLDARTITIPVTLNGGPGVDRFFGGAAADTINAKDDTADSSFSCGGGADVVNADASPNDPITTGTNGCETVHKT
jgi:subtilisin family serine protease